jgi:1-acyl-sn-glycerol-3-phosphate acyltransferase
MTMRDIILGNGSYLSPSYTPDWLSRLFPTPVFHFREIRVVVRAGKQAKTGKYDYQEWAQSSDDIVTALESVGIRLNIAGLDRVAAVEGPCVVVANHMSALETFVIPSLLLPTKKHTFVIKESLLNYPIFKYVMRSRDPIAVSRKNPREDFKTVMEEGKKRLEQGISIVIFPQTTRTAVFNPEHFNSMGVKLARHAGVPVIPLALKTDAWGNGPGFLKDFGRIRPQRQVFLEFGEPLKITGNGQKENDAVICFIQNKLTEWEKAES